MDIAREQWREKVIRTLFSSHVTPMYNVLKESSRVPSTILWENVAVRINSVYEKLFAVERDSIQLHRLHSDFNFLKNAPGEVFQLRENPIRPYLKIGEEFQLHPARKTCCLFCKLKENDEGITHCANCPINVAVK